MVKGLLFDFNGTLFFDSEYHLRAFSSFYRHYGLPVKSDEYIVNNVFGRANGEIFREEFIADATDEEVAAFSESKEIKYRELCDRHPEKFVLGDGVDDMLDYLVENSIPFCMATGSPYDNVKFYFDKLGIGKWFSLDNIVYCDGTFPGKPAPDIYRIAAQRLGLDVSECAVFEDGTSGIISANTAGAAKVIAVWEEGLPSPITDSTRIDGAYHSFADWRQMLASIGII